MTIGISLVNHHYLFVEFLALFLMETYCSNPHVWLALYMLAQFNPTQPYLTSDGYYVNYEPNYISMYLIYIH